MADQDTETVIVDQARGAAASARSTTFSGVIGAAPVDPAEPDRPDRRRPTESPRRRSDHRAGRDRPPCRRSDIPLPGDIPIDEPRREAPGAGTEPPSRTSRSPRRASTARPPWASSSAARRSATWSSWSTNVGDDDRREPDRPGLGRPLRRRRARDRRRRGRRPRPGRAGRGHGPARAADGGVRQLPRRRPGGRHASWAPSRSSGRRTPGACSPSTCSRWCCSRWGVRRRVLRRRKPGAALPAPGDGADAVVDLAAADAWWAYRAGTGPRPVPAWPPGADGAPARAVGPAARRAAAGRGDRRPRRRREVVGAACSRKAVLGRLNIVYCLRNLPKLSQSERAE